MLFTDVLKQFSVSKAYIKNGRIFVFLNNYKLPSKQIKIVKSCPYVGQHHYGAGKRVFLDDDIVVKERWQLSIAVHETCERWLQDTFFSSESNIEAYPKIHPIAEKLEKDWHIRKFGMKSWNRYSKEVDRVYDKENS